MAERDQDTSKNQNHFQICHKDVNEKNWKIK